MADDHVVLSVENLSAGYGDGQVLFDLSLELRQGSIAVVLGRNGVGKSTLVRCVAGLLPVRRGKVRLGKTDITNRPPHEVAALGVGVLPQGKRVFPSLSVHENLDLGHRLRAIRKRRGADTSLAWTQGRVFEVFSVFRHRLGVRAGSLSGGEQQMLAIARLMVGGPRILVLDEPSEALSPARVSDLRVLLDELRREGMSVLLVEQNIGFAAQLADMAYVIDKGSVVLSCTGDEIRGDTRQIEEFLTI